ncbi:hypothetical protein [Serratia marcescens]|uniref:hypothetical protein n=1 Tax=Serratia marcescens TaxID=615 RepID=UPI00293310A7|nr:hypothetical protein [Serratia marcescens]MDV2101510.1 hypothetical protein [Serratia marcescens]HBL7108450.1 hypothetical protein [Serratia marcescens]HBL7331119.1 hypothetical protein [Serratia marcescens]
MSEIISSIMSGVKDRTSGIYGYLATSFLIFNWSNIYFLFFSGKTAEQKIVSISLSFNWWLHALAPLLVGLSLCILSPFISTSIKFIQRHAVWWGQRIEFNNLHFTQDLEDERLLKIREKTDEARELEKKLGELNESLKRVQSRFDATAIKHDEMVANEYGLSLAVESKTDEMRKLEIELAKLNQEYGNFEKLRVLYNASSENNRKNLDRKEMQIDIMLGMIKSLIDLGYIPENTEDVINSELEKIGYRISTNNPLRVTPRFVDHETTIKEGMVINRAPEQVTLPPPPGH